jgi:hypothetical protein
MTLSRALIVTGFPANWHFSSGHELAGNQQWLPSAPIGVNNLIIHSTTGKKTYPFSCSSSSPDSAMIG